MATLNQVANVLEKLAAYVDANEAQANTERQKKASARQAEIEALAVRYSAATGDEMPDAVRQKLANSDESVVALIGNIIEKSAAEHVTTLGGPSASREVPQPRTTKEAAEAAEAQFANWCLS